jgi:hypothetical protein
MNTARTRISSVTVKTPLNSFGLRWERFVIENGDYVRAMFKCVDWDTSGGRVRQSKFIRVDDHPAD